MCKSTNKCWLVYDCGWQLCNASGTHVYYSPLLFLCMSCDADYRVEFVSDLLLEVVRGGMHQPVHCIIVERSAIMIRAVSSLQCISKCRLCKDWICNAMCCASCDIAYQWSVCTHSCMSITNKRIHVNIRLPCKIKTRCQPRHKQIHVGNEWASPLPGCVSVIGLRILKSCAYSRQPTYTQHGVECV